MRGTRRSARQGLWSYGSSPRMRGTPASADRVSCLVRFIPAYAGNTSLSSHKFKNSAVHPRVCGEHAGISMRPFPVSGSSPRMRGTRPSSGTDPPACRFIPAYAGNTSRGCQNVSLNAVHPRVCGEHTRPMDRTQKRYGSSPRMRGTPSPKLDQGVGNRFIPAYAGNTPIDISQLGHSPVHPRVCGEHNASRLFERSRGGSSPRMRGTPFSSKGITALLRFIPAYAGNTFVAICSAVPPPVHPRVCGEHPT